MSMFSFVIVLFFSVTGLTLNHLDWFPEKEVLKEQEGKLRVDWVNVSDTSKIKKLEIVELFRKDYHVKGLVNDFRIDEREVSISFQGPGYTADVFIQREDGKFQLSTRELGTIAFLNDLHKGRDTGKAWRLPRVGVVGTCRRSTAEERQSGLQGRRVTQSWQSRLHQLQDLGRGDRRTNYRQ